MRSTTSCDKVIVHRLIQTRSVQTAVSPKAQHRLHVILLERELHNTQSKSKSWRTVYANRYTIFKVAMSVECPQTAISPCVLSNQCKNVFRTAAPDHQIRVKCLQLSFSDLIWRAKAQ